MIALPSPSGDAGWRSRLHPEMVWPLDYPIRRNQLQDVLRRASIKRMDDDERREIPQIGEAKTVVGLAGTVSTVAAVEQGLAAYDRDAIHHFRLTKEAAEDVFRTLATERRADRIHNPGLEEARADVIVGGCCALVAILRRLALDEVLCSEADILDGLALSLLA